MQFGNSILPPKELIQPIALLLKSLFPYPRKILLAVSGGPDSKALLHTCLHLQEKNLASFGVAHVDHSWRKESEREALILKKEVESFGLPFHLHVLNPSSLLGNLENSCREERFRFFEKISQTFGYELLLLAHHRDDLAETVLKRVLEGAFFSHFHGMQKLSQWGRLKLGRPWLDVPKKTLLNFLNRSEIPYFEDVTNLDPKYLRARMRASLFPFLESQFGKSMTGPLARLSKESVELTLWMKERLKPLFKEGNKGHLDATALASSFEVRFAVREWISQLSLEVSSKGIDILVEHVLNKNVGRSLELAFGKIEVDRSHLFFVPKTLLQIDQPLPLKPGSYQWGGWKVDVREISQTFEEKKGWKSAWEGTMAVAIPLGTFFLGRVQDVINKEAKVKLLKHWSAKKVPAFLRPLIPIIGNPEGEVAKDFLSDSAIKPKNGVYEVILQNQF